MEAQLIAPDRLAHIPDHVRHVLAQVKRELVDYYGDRLQKLVLFGSYARGDFHDESDIDLMPVIDGTSKDDLKSEGLFDIMYPHLLQDGIKVSVIPSLAHQYECANTFLLMFIHKDGIEL
ncbi:nucleotidyltransferase family protein [Fibrella aquatilis]|uniref:Nucleotidyltransferase domain-containing protein n=1 Tax=Fibrella aquatilis TaxID=2817059 RepID=A0A939G6F0_9BACT|nr:nucleotidyltransferase domain-containing protein [Fibrella aquatilis]MBO0930663.1 nucleotidyltransferase domain-containing protein [Fibrella aquatilis]